MHGVIKHLTHRIVSPVTLSIPISWPWSVVISVSSPISIELQVIRYVTYSNQIDSKFWENDPYHYIIKGTFFIANAIKFTPYTLYTDACCFAEYNMLCSNILPHIIVDFDSQNLDMGSYEYCLLALVIWMGFSQPQHLFENIPIKQYGK